MYRRFLTLTAAITLFAGFCHAQHSRTLTDTIQSRVLNAPRAYNVYLPQSFDIDTTRRFPVLYLLHGLYGNNEDWVKQGALKSIADRLIKSGMADEMVIVTPDAGGPDPSVYQSGYFNVQGWNYDTFFFTEFMPEFEKKYRVIGDREHRAIAGLSMGGGGSTSYAQHHPELFSSLYAMSALMRLPDDRKANGDSGDKVVKFNRSVIDRDCISFINESDDKRLDDLRTVAWFVDCGDDDFLLHCNLDFYKTMQAAGIPCELRVRDGMHNWHYWRRALEDALPFVSRHFTK